MGELTKRNKLVEHNATRPRSKMQRAQSIYPVAKMYFLRMLPRIYNESDLVFTADGVHLKFNFTPNTMTRKYVEVAKLRKSPQKDPKTIDTLRTNIYLVHSTHGQYSLSRTFNMIVSRCFPVQ